MHDDNSVALAHKQTILIKRRPFVGEVSANFFANRGYCVVSAMDPNSSILGFLDRSCYYFFQEGPQLYSWGWVDPIPDSLLLRKSGSTGIQTQNLWICSQELWPLEHRRGPWMHDASSGSSWRILKESEVKQSFPSEMIPSQCVLFTTSHPHWLWEGFSFLTLLVPSCDKYSGPDKGLSSLNSCSSLLLVETRFYFLTISMDQNDHPPSP
jgi:hypothetical protein